MSEWRFTAYDLLTEAKLTDLNLAASSTMERLLAEFR